MDNAVRNDDSKSIALVATLHDPSGSMAPFLQKTVPVLRQLYQHLIVIATRSTAATTVGGLRAGAIRVDADGGKDIGENRRRVLRRAVEDTGAAYVHYCDLDRLFYWVLNHPDELAEVVTRVIPTADYVAIGRTPGAFATHPPVQQELESMTNEVFSALAQRQMDVTAGSCGIGQAAARYLLGRSREMSNATDTEWPSLIRWAEQYRLEYVAVDGLAFETTTFAGEAAWTAAHTAGNWAKRARLAHESIAAAIRVHGAASQGERKL